MNKTCNCDSNLRLNIASMKVPRMVAQAKKAYSDVDSIKKCATVIVEETAVGNETKLISKIDNIPLC